MGQVIELRRGEEIALVEEQDIKDFTAIGFVLPGSEPEAPQAPAGEDPEEPDQVGADSKPTRRTR